MNGYAYAEAARFMRKVGSMSDCWQWNGPKDSHGYGAAWMNGRMEGAHRVAYQLFVGPIPQGLHLDHLCRVPACVNPAHLEPVTSGENVLRGVGQPAINARKTHCKRGHPFTPENIYSHPNGGRECRICKRALDRSYYWRDRQ